MIKAGQASRVEHHMIRVLAGVVVLFTLLPIFVIVILSFTATTTLQFPPPEIGLRWYREMWLMIAGPDSGFLRLKEAFLTTLIIASLASLLCVVAGVPAAYALTRRSFFTKGLVEELIGLPVVFPAVVLGVALLTFVSSLGLRLGTFQLVIAHAIIGLPFMVRNCLASLTGVDQSLEAAAQTLGAPPLRAFFETTLPLMRAGIASGTMLVFVLSFNEFTLAYFLYTVDVFPLSIWLFQQSNTSFSPVILAISAVMIVVNVVAILAVDRVAGIGGVGTGKSP